MLSSCWLVLTFCSSSHLLGSWAMICTLADFLRENNSISMFPSCQFKPHAKRLPEPCMDLWNKIVHYMTSETSIQDAAHKTFTNSLIYKSRLHFRIEKFVSNFFIYRVIRPFGLAILPKYAKNG